MDIYLRVGFWYRCGVPDFGLTAEERNEIIQSAQGSHLAEHVDMSEDDLKVLDDETLVHLHYAAMVAASR